MNRPRTLTYITGVTCSGKTTLSRYMNTLGYSTQDIDSTTTKPQTAWLDWLRWRAAEHLHEFTEGDMNEHFVSGIVWPHAVIESPAWKPAMKAGVKVRFFMLDPPKKILKRRIYKRAKDKPRSDRKGLYEYNLGLREKLFYQVRACNSGLVVWELDKVHQSDQLATFATDDISALTHNIEILSRKRIA